MNTLNNFKLRIQNIRDFCRRNSALFVTVIVALSCTVGIVYLEDIWNWSARITETPSESNSAILRNLVLIIAPVVALILALWRLSIADRQSKIADLQQKTAQQHLHNDQFQKGLDLLDNPSLTIRLGGITGLQKLSLESMDNHHLHIMGLLSYFVRYPPKYAGDEPESPQFNLFEKENISYNTERVDIIEILEYLGRRGNKEREFEKIENYILDFRHADLSYANLEDSDWSSTNMSFVYLKYANIKRCNFENAVLNYADLTQTELLFCNLTGASLHYANLTKSNLFGCVLRKADLCFCIMRDSILFEANLENVLLYKGDLSGANFKDASLFGTDLSDAILRNAKNLTQQQIDQALAEFGNPPDLTGLKDHVTGKPLVWKN